MKELARIKAVEAEIEKGIKEAERRAAREQERFEAELKRRREGALNDARVRSQHLLKRRIKEARAQVASIGRETEKRLRALKRQGKRNIDPAVEFIVGHLKEE